MASRVPRPAAGEATQGEPPSPEEPIAEHGLPGVLRARGMEPAPRGKKGGYEPLIGIQREDEHPP